MQHPCISLMRWDQSGDGGETWIPVDGDSRLQVTLDKDMTYRAIFESPYKIENMQVAEYALPSSGNNWYVNMAVIWQIHCQAI